MRPGKQAAIEILRHVQDTSEVGPRKRLGVMIVAENASLRQGGESSLAIQWFRGLLKAGVDVRLLVHVRSKLELDQSLSRFSSRIHYVPEVPLQKIFWKFGEALPDHVRDFTAGWLVHLITQFMQRRGPAPDLAIQDRHRSRAHPGRPAHAQDDVRTWRSGGNRPHERQHDLSAGIQ